MKNTRKTKVFTQHTSPDGTFVGICAREIHAVLGHTSSFHDWLRFQVRKHLVQGKEYAVFKKQKAGNHGRPGNIYLISPSAADRLLGKKPRRPAAAPAIPDVQPEITPPTDAELIDLQAQAEKMLPILQTMFGDEETLSVDARQLHEALGVKTRFDDWMRYRLDTKFFEEGRDYIEVFLKNEENSQNPSGGRPRTDYALSLDMAKHFAMMSQCKMGYAVREYFIQAEKMLRQTQKQKQLLWNPALYSEEYPEDGRLVRERQLKEFLIEIETMAQLVCPENPEAAEKFINWSVCINLDIIELRDTRRHLVHAVREVLKACHQVFSQRGFDPAWADKGGLLITWNPTSCSYAATHPCFEPVSMFLTADQFYRNSTQLRPDFQLRDIVNAIEALEDKDVLLSCAKGKADLRFDSHNALLAFFRAFYDAAREKEDELHGRNRKTMDKAHSLYERKKDRLLYQRRTEAKQAEKAAARTDEASRQLPGNPRTNAPRISSWRNIR